MTIVVRERLFGPSGRMLGTETVHYTRDIPRHLLARARARRRKLRRLGWLWVPKSLPRTAGAATRIADDAWCASKDRALAIIRPPHLRRPARDITARAA